MSMSTKLSIILSTVKVGQLQVHAHRAGQKPAVQYSLLRYPLLRVQSVPAPSPTRHTQYPSDHDLQGAAAEEEAEVETEGLLRLQWRRGTGVGAEHHTCAYPHRARLHAV